MSDRLLDLLRHGEVQGGPCFRGERDDPLSEHGWEQMRQATAEGAGWTRILSSPACRCAAFATDLAGRLALPIEERPAFRERGFGAWEGLTADAIPAAELQAFWANPSGHTPPGAEPFAAFRARVLDGWHRVLGEGDPHTLLVTHGGVIRVLASEVLGMSEDAFLLFEAPLACQVRLRLPTPPWRPSLVWLRTL